MPSSPAPLPSSRVTPINSVTPNKRWNSRSKVTNRGDKRKHANVSMHQSNKKKCNNTCHQLDLPVIPDKAEAVTVTLRSSRADTRTSRYDMRECVFKCTRSSKPKCENQQEINYANLNDGLDEEDVYLPPRKKPGRKGPGFYPSEDRLKSHDLQTDRVRKKQKLMNNREKELDLEKIMDELDTLPDIVQN